VQLQLKTWQLVEDYLKAKTGIIIPIGSTEQHGPTTRRCSDGRTDDGWHDPSKIDRKHAK